MITSTHRGAMLHNSSKRKDGEGGDEMGMGDGKREARGAHGKGDEEEQMLGTWRMKENRRIDGGGKRRWG